MKHKLEIKKEETYKMDSKYLGVHYLNQDVTIKDLIRFIKYIIHQIFMIYWKIIVKILPDV